MAEQHPPEVLGSLPRTRPHRRSAKRPQPGNVEAANGGDATGRAVPPARRSAKPRPATEPRPAARSAAKSGSRSTPRSDTRGEPGTTSRAETRSERLRQPPQPRGIPSQPRTPVPPSSPRPDALGTALQAAAELTEIGLSLSARALRRVIARLPRP